MSIEIPELTADQIQRVKEILTNLIAYLREKRSRGTLIPDEEFILNSLIRPERGDVKIYILNDGREMQIFIHNRRDDTNPFAVMDFIAYRKYSDRKMIDGFQNALPEGKYGLFVISQQDRELLASASTNLVTVFSSVFSINDPIEIKKEKESYENKPYDACSDDEKWMIYKKGMRGDARFPLIEADLFSFKTVYAKYNQKYREERLVLAPGKYNQIVGQMIRDIYPYGIRVTLRKDYVQDHKKNIAEVHKALNELVKSIEGRLNITTDGDYKEYLKELKNFTCDIIVNDPELTRFV